MTAYNIDWQVATEEKFLETKKDICECSDERMKHLLEAYAEAEKIKEAQSDKFNDYKTDISDEAQSILMNALEAAVEYVGRKIYEEREYKEDKIADLETRYRGFATRDVLHNFG